MQRVATFAVLGDSAASGVGDTDGNGTSRGWSYYLAKNFKDPLVYINFSRPGAKSDEILHDQLPKAIIHMPTITAVIVGGNDALRNGFSPECLHQNLRSTIKQLNAIGSEVLLLQLHDPTLIVPMPKTLGTILRRRINAVNQVTQAIAAEFGTEILKTRELEGIYERKVWHTDRMHPSKFGHQLLAHHFREILSKRWEILPVALDPVIKKPRAESIKWMLKNGTPWFLKRSVDLLPAALYLIVCEHIRNIFRRNHEISARIFYPEFVNHREASYLEVFEERVS
jgi:lysophospholipase L1-like esterase